MKNLLVTCLLILVFSTVSFGKFLILPLEERVKNNNLIVVGTLESISKRETTEFTYYKGTLVVEKIIFGKTKTTQDLPLKVTDKLQIKWQNSNMIACRLMFSENYKAIWFLQIDYEGNIESLSPSSRTELSDLAEIKKLLKQQKNSSDDVNFVKTQDDFEEIPQPLAFKGNLDELTQNSPFTEDSKERPNSSLLTLFVILASISLNYLLYRSRFKIR